MPLDVLGRTRATLIGAASLSFFYLNVSARRCLGKITPWPMGLGNLVKLNRAGDRPLQLSVFNEEFLVSASHQLALITSLPFVHTARRSYRSDGPVKSPELGLSRDPGNWVARVRKRSKVIRWQHLVALFLGKAD